MLRPARAQLGIVASAAAMKALLMRLQVVSTSPPLALIRSLLQGDHAASSEDRRLAVFRHMVETHLTEHRPIAFYARSIGTTVRTLTRLTRRHLGQSPQGLINRRLALEAQRLLRYTGASVTTVAGELGFADPSYFSRFYLRMTGHRPQDDRHV